MDATVPTLEAIRPLLAAFGQAHPEIVRLEVFGSVARGEATPESDVDVVAVFRAGSLPRGMAGFAFVDDLERELAHRLGRYTHLVDYLGERDPGAGTSTSVCFERAVARDARQVYEADPTAG